MAYGDNNKHFEHIKLPVTWAVLGVVGAIFIGAVLLFLGDRRDVDDPTSYGARSTVDKVASLPDKALALPVHVVGDGTNFIDDYFFAVRENRALKKKVAQLQQDHDRMVELADINSRYEALLKLRTEPPVETVTARSVSVSRGPFANNRLIDAGSRKHITFGNPVVTDQGLVGRVVGVTSDVSRVLMVTDITSNVPVMILRTDARAMMRGDGGGYPKLEFVRGKDSLKAGDQILSSGDGGVFPRGLPVGEAVKGVDGVWRVRLYSNRAPIDFVNVLLFKDFSQLPNADTLLRSPPVSDVLPPPAVPAVAAVAASSSSSSAATVSASASSAASVKPAAPKAVAPKPRPVSAKPASSAPATPELKPFTPSADISPSAARPEGNHP